MKKCLLKRKLSKTQTKYKLVEKEGSQQNSYNLDIPVKNQLLECGAIKSITSDNPKYEMYELSDDYSIKLGNGIIELIGSEYLNSTLSLKFAYSKSHDGTIKFQIKKTDNKEGNFIWFKELYDNNIEGSIFTIDLDIDQKIIYFDNEIPKLEETSDWELQEINENNMNLNSRFKHNRILFGAPGTGKSFQLNKDKDELLGEGSINYERVTFHPDYSYANFVGCYKPVSVLNKETNKKEIEYKYIPGPFLRTITKALKSIIQGNPKAYLLIIEEINRANVAAVFGDVFQLLDRKDGVSEYPIQTSEDMRQYLADELGGEPEDFETIVIPNNVFIWATMNSADQGVFPMDTAFKRRWDFTYIGINNNEEKIEDKTVTFNGNQYKWNNVRKAINDYLSEMKINEDKLMGPFFIKPDDINDDKFDEVFKNKVLMYLFEDAGKQKRSKLFKSNLTIYSEICNDYDKNKFSIFSDEILSILEEYQK